MGTPVAQKVEININSGDILVPMSLAHFELEP